MLEDLQLRADEALALAQAAGANDAWVSVSRSREVEFSYRDGALEQVKDSTSMSLGVQLYVDGRYSSHSTTDLRADRLESFVSEAVALTRALQPDPFRQIPDPALFEGRSDVDLEQIDGSVQALDRDQRVAWCEAIDAASRADERVISATAGVSDGHSVSAMASTNGFSGHKESTWLWMGTEVTVRGEGDARPEDWCWVGGPHVEDLLATGEIAQLALDGAVARLGTTKGPTKKTTMVVHPRSTGSLIWRLLRPANGSSLQQEQSFWAGKLGQQAVSDKLTILDDPLRPRGLSSRHFDGEGIAAKPMPIIEAGVLSNLYIDTYYGRKLEMAPTTGGPSNRIVAPGDKDMAGLIGDVGEGILVTSWLGGNSDSTTGDFSFGVRGHLIEGGQIGAPVGEMNVTGNLLELFGQLALVGNDPWRYSSLLCPTLVFEGVQFSGA